MGCGCRKRATVDTRQAVDAGSRVMYEVFVNDTSSGRRFNSLITAQSYAKKIGGEVRTV